MDVLDSGLVAWDIEEWMSPVENRKSISKEKLPGPKKVEILVGEVREMILQSIAQVCLAHRYPTDFHSCAKMVVSFLHFT